MPAAQHAKEVKVHLCTKQGHGASSAEGLGGYVGSVEAGLVVVNCGRVFELVGYVLGLDRPEAVVVIVGCEGRRLWCVVCAVVDDT